MKKYPKILKNICLAVCFSVCAARAPLFSEFRLAEIPAVDVEENSAVTLKIASYLYNTAKSKKIEAEFENTKYVECRYDSGAVVIKSSASFGGLTYFTMKLKNADGDKCAADVLVKARKKAITVVKFKPVEKSTDVFIAGSFNNWNSGSMRMNRNEAGEFMAELDLQPGKYQYKFVVDGKWITDPGNAEKAADGLGGSNSLLTVSGEKPELIPLSIKDGKIKIEFSGKDYLSCLAVINNSVFAQEMKNGVFEIKAPKDPFNLRIIACDKNGNFTNEICLSGGENFNWGDGVIYFAFIDRFYDAVKSTDTKIQDPELSDEVNYMGGDLKGITKKINDGYFKELGINVLWLSPVMDNPDKAYKEDNPPYKKYSGYHGYWPLDIYKVEERFGNEADLKELVEAAHENGIKVILDAVFNHVHIESNLYKGNYRCFTPLDLSDGRKNIRLFDEYPLTTWFDSFNPTFDFEKYPEARDAMVNNALWWINRFNVDGFRLDAVKHVPHIFWKELRKSIQDNVEYPQKKKFFMIGETISSREKIMEYVNSEELDSQFDFPLYWTIRDVFAWQTRGFDALESDYRASMDVYGPGRPMSAFIGNHDFARFATLADGDVLPGMNDKDDKIIAVINSTDTYKKIELAMAFILTNPGIPMIYYGDEIGLPGKGDPDNRRMMKFDLSPDEKDLLHSVTAYIKIRNENPATRYGLNKTIIAEKDFYAYKNIWFDNELVVALNRSNESVEKKLGLTGEWLNLITGEKTPLEKISLQPLSAAMFKKIEQPKKP